MSDPTKESGLEKSESAPSGSARTREVRRARLATELRANIGKRRQQARERRRGEVAADTEPDPRR